MEEKNPHMQSIEIGVNDVHLWLTSFNYYKCKCDAIGQLM